MDISQARNQAIKFATEACAEDRSGNYVRALNLYEQAVKYMLHAAKYDKNKVTRSMYLERAKSYVERAEELKKIGVASESSAEAAKVKVRGGGERGDKTNDADNEKIGVELSAEDREPVDIDAELAKIVGLDSVKQQIRDWQHQLKLDLRRRELGFDIGTIEVDHMAFMGNPGTGKTTIARLIARILRDLNLLKTDTVIEVQRSDLVEGYVGQTATKTRKVIEKARGGVLFVDEAYRLAPGGNSGNSRDFGEEAVNEMMSVMQQKDSPVFIFAGYVDDMRDFFALNEGLFRRVNRRFMFEDMSVQDIIDLFRIILKHSPFELDASVSDEELVRMLEEHTTKSQRSKLNGSIVKLTLSRAKAHLDRRLTITSTIAELSTYTATDIINALKELPSAF